MIRQERKLEHVQLSVKLGESQRNPWFGDLTLVYNALPEIDYKSINTEIEFLGKELSAPILINAITGGHANVTAINGSLARIAARNRLAIAVGSQTSALEDESLTGSYRIVRTENPKGVVLANLTARSSWEDVYKAVDMLEADAIQLHLNVSHELAMAEGDRIFKGILANIEKVIKKSNVPVIVKEVGFGLSRSVVAALYQCGVKYIDIGGKGGTNFIAIERLRKGLDSQEDYSIGIPTAVSLLETLSLNLPLFVIASGGIVTGYEIACALSLGANMVGIAGHFLQILVRKSEAALQEEVTKILEDLRQIMLMSGAVDIKALRNTPIIILGKTGEWMLRRGIDINHYAQRP
ncbi:type 2 isopentenyl-diphosphate Delta-isomerase [Desulfitobacterium sp. AusDCA]|uniref:type 2 isopentenyl-diphosphate Delta-isomerase n=1 Tax=Desulfitobacterium sp. AusDCA TaxID=3240383 RepID=UPI003DA747E7